MLLVQQTAEQRRMLQLYGQTIVQMDATYKTNAWGFPLFLMTVVTNHGHGFPVALFFVEEETTEMIAEALEILTTWNSGWQPKYVMMDKSDMEQGAVERVMGSGTRILLCKFHRQQAWWRWLTERDHQVPKDM